MPDTLSWEALESLRTLGGDEFVQQMVAVFLEEAQRHVDRMAGLQADDLASVKFEAHALKGSSANLGAEALSALAATLENAARAGDTATIADALQRLPATWAVTKQALLAL